jgi:response regulator RpfG family c-di-GMP phosphodiesterase
MKRPCFLVIDREFPGSISTRKLVLETAKFNVITAYSGREALEIFMRFRALDGVVMDGELDDIPADKVVEGIKALEPNCPVVAICPPGFAACPSADYQLESYHPANLLETLRGLKPNESAQIEKHEEAINKERLN